MNEVAQILTTITLTNNDDDNNYNWAINLTDYLSSSSNVSSLYGNSTGNNISHRRDFLSSPQWVLMALMIIPVWILGGNSLVLLAVLYQRNLQNLSNRVIASLAFTDLLLGLIVVPLGIYQLILGRWSLGFPVCLMWTGSDVILSTASIMHLCAIALYRYHGIANPLHVRSYATQGRRVTVLVVPAWSVAVALSIPFVVQGVLDRSYVLQPIDPLPLGQGDPGGAVAPSAPISSGLGVEEQLMQCGIFNQTFAIYSSLVSFFIPLAIMVFADIRSIQILRKSIQLPILLNYAYIRRSRHHTLDARSPTAAEASEEATTVDTLNSPPPGRDAIQVTAASRQLLPTITLTHPDATDTREGVGFDGRSNGVGSEMTLLGPGQTMTSTVDLTLRSRSRSRSMVYLDMLASCGKTKVNGRERRAEKTLIWVFASFVALWLPFFCTNLAYGFCGDRCNIPGQLFQVFTWLGYLSSGVNPCIYTLLNKDFRTAFRNLLLCQHEKLTRTAQSFGPTSTTNGTLRCINPPQLTEEHR